MSDAQRTRVLACNCSAQLRPLARAIAGAADRHTIEALVDRLPGAGAAD